MILGCILLHIVTKECHFYCV
uniref:Uncharacterized protein n=1 Tax=Arundo donax TaxID=35708 RepID=A0A0A8YA50_ARUDO